MKGKSEKYKIKAVKLIFYSKYDYLYDQFINFHNI